MRTKTNILATAAALAITATGANAASVLIDLTDESSYSFSTSEITGAGGGAAFTITPNMSVLTQGPDGPGAIGPLAGENDGIGIRDDEVTFPAQFLSLEFSRDVVITALYFLDLFQSPDGHSSAEAAEVTSNTAATGTFSAQVPIRVNPVGYGAFTGLALDGNTFSFAALASNDTVANPDYALAGFEYEVAPVPLPAGIALLAGALGGLGLMRRRKAA